MKRKTLSEQYNKFKTIKIRPYTLSSVELLGPLPISFWNHLMDIILFHNSLILVDLVLRTGLDNLNFRRRILYLCLQSHSECFHGGLILCLGLMTHDSKSNQSRDTAIGTQAHLYLLLVFHPLFIYQLFCAVTDY